LEIDYGKSADTIFLSLVTSFKKLKPPSDRDPEQFRQLDIRLRLAERLGLQKYSTLDKEQARSSLLKYWRTQYRIVELALERQQLKE
jgi:hypothetical protein